MNWTDEPAELSRAEQQAHRQVNGTAWALFGEGESPWAAGEMSVESSGCFSVANVGSGFPLTGTRTGTATGTRDACRRKKKNKAVVLGLRAHQPGGGMQRVNNRQKARERERREKGETK